MLAKKVLEWIHPGRIKRGRSPTTWIQRISRAMLGINLFEVD